MDVNRTRKLALAAIGKAVRAARKARALSQEDLADVCALDRTYLSGIERGMRNPTILSLWKIADALAVPLTELVADAESLAKNQDPPRGT
jgi:transcriptional regulator with XRE-family HTH domain